MTSASYPASLSQRMLWFMTRRSAPGAADTPRLYAIHNLDQPALERALGDLRRRHEALRTRITGAGPRLTQEIFSPEPLPVEWVDADEDEGGLTMGSRVRGADQEVMVRVQRGRTRTLMLLDIDHMLTDAWTYEVIRTDLDELYSARLAGREAVLPEVGWQYRQFAESQINRLRGSTLRQLQDSWLQRLSGASAVALPSMADRVSRRQRTAAVLRFHTDAASAKALRGLGLAGGTTVSAAALAVYFLALWLVSEQDDLSIGSIFANRTRYETWCTAGLFAHMLPLRLMLSDRATVRDLLRRAHETMAHALAHQELPMSLLPSGALGRNTAVGINTIVFHVLPTIASGPGSQGVSQIAALPAPLTHRTGARFDLELALRPQATRIGGFFRYATDRFSPEWIDAFRALYFDLVITATMDLDQSLSGLRRRAARNLEYLGGISLCSSLN